MKTFPKCEARDDRFPPLSKQILAKISQVRPIPETLLVFNYRLKIKAYASSFPAKNYVLWFNWVILSQSIFVPLFFGLLVVLDEREVRGALWNLLWCCIVKPLRYSIMRRSISFCSQIYKALNTISGFNCAKNEKLNRKQMKRKTLQTLRKTQMNTFLSYPPTSI